MTSHMNVLIADDEPLARERLRYLIGQVDPFHALEYEVENGREAVTLCIKHNPDIVLMDIRMPGMSGLEAASEISQLDSPPAIIFCTAYDSHALDAFETQAAGYLLKPIRQEDLDLALHRASKINKLQLASLENIPQENQQAHIAAKTIRGIELIPLSDIIYFMADSKYVTVYHAHGEVLIDDPLKKIEQKHSQHFVRVHRNALVRKNSIVSLTRDEKGHFIIYLRNVERPLSVSRRHVSSIKKVMQTL